MEISIHALVKRATCAYSHNISKFYISIHALVKRATLAYIIDTDVFAISIHALVKRATLGLIGTCIYNGNFNPRPREEGDRAYC